MEPRNYDLETHPDFDGPWSWYDWVLGGLVALGCGILLPMILVWSMISGYMKARRYEKQV